MCSEDGGRARSLWRLEKAKTEGLPEGAQPCRHFELSSEAQTMEECCLTPRGWGRLRIPTKTEVVTSQCRPSPGPGSSPLVASRPSLSPFRLSQPTTREI